MGPDQIQRRGQWGVDADQLHLPESADARQMGVEVSDVPEVVPDHHVGLGLVVKGVDHRADVIGGVQPK
jgi:hypothetical protein